MLDIIAEAVTIRDLEGNIAYANQAALASMGFATIGEMQSRSSAAIMDDYVAEDEHGGPLSIDDVPSMRMLHGQTVDPLLMRTVHRGTGEVFWRLLKTAPIHDESGQLIAAVTVIEDVTAVKTAEMRMRMLADSGRILASSLDYQQTLHNVANVAVPLLADWCSVDLVDDRLRREHWVIAHQDPAKIPLAERLRAYEAPEIDPDGVAGQVIRTGRSVLFDDIPEERVIRTATNDEHRQLLRELAMRSALLVPLRVPTRTIGVMTLITAESHRRLTQDDVELAEQLARRAAVAVENARLHTTLGTIAETLQQSLRPDELPEIPGWEVASLYRPAGGGQRVDVGGDFYELFPSPSGWLGVIGDVTGKGVGAAALTSLLRHGSRFASRYDARPGAVLRELDEALRTRPSRSLCTAQCIRLHSDHVVMSSGGHPPALRVQADGTVAETHASGPLLGAFDDGEWPEETVPIGRDGLLLLYTDGVTETVGATERFGLERLKAVMSEHAGDSPDGLLAGLDAALTEFGAGLHADDVAALALRPST